MDMLNEIQRCFRNGKALYTRHAREEMQKEIFGRIREEEVFETIMKGEVVEGYENDKPYPSMLISGTTDNERHLHVVCAYSVEDDLAIVVTVYQPDPNLWIDYRRRKR